MLAPAMTVGENVANDHTTVRGNCMLRIDLQGDAGPELLSDNIAYLRSIGRYMYAGPDDWQVARHDMGLWQIEGKSYIYLDVPCPVMLTFEGDDNSQRVEFGPFPQMRFTEGFVMIGEELRTPLAHFSDRIERWVLLEDQREMPILILKPAMIAT